MERTFHLSFIKKVIKTFLILVVSCGASGVVVAGPIDTLQPGHWYEVPNSRLDSVQPASNPGGALAGIIQSWSGGVLDSSRDRLVVWGGGHSDYAGNEVYAFDINSGQWARLTNPSVANNADTCTYPDGEPRSRHTYNYIDYLPNHDVMLSAGGSGPWMNGGGGFCSELHAFNFSTNTWDTNWGQTMPANGNLIGSWAVVHPTTGDVWRRGAMGGNLLRLDGTSKTWTQYASSKYLEIYGTPAIDPTRNLLVAVGGYGGKKQILVWDLNNPNANPVVPPTTGDTLLERKSSPGFTYDPVSDKFVGWAGGTQVYTLDPDTWVWSYVGPAAGNSVSPTPAESKGTNGRFRYVPSKNAFVLVNQVNENVFYYKLSAGTPSATAPTVTLNSSLSTVASGASVTLSWSTSGASSCTASGGWSGTKTTSGSEVVGPLTGDTTFNMSCTNAQGSTNRSVTVAVTTAVAGGVASLLVTNRSSANQTNVPVTFGHVFHEDDVASTQSVTAKLSDGTPIALQVDKKASHKNGSLRHAVLTANIPNLAAGGSDTITLSSAAMGAPGAAVSLNDLLATSFDATVSLNVSGTTYTASAADLLQNTTSKQWLSGEMVSEWIVGGAVKDAGNNPHPHLTVYFHVRAYAGSPINRVRVDAVIENNWSFIANPSNVTYDIAISSGGATVYSQSNLTHYHHARWHRAFWWGTDPQMYVKHDVAYLQNSKAVPKYENVTHTDAYLNSVRSSVAPMNNGDHTNNMDATGAQDAIGPLPRWDAVYVTSTDKRAFDFMRANSDGGGSYAAHYRDEATGLPITIDDFPNASISNNNSSSATPKFPNTSGGNPYFLGSGYSHQPLVGYVPYLVTGDYYYLEELQFWSSYNLMWTNHEYRNYAQGVWYKGSVRGMAWAYRTLGYTAYITPDAHPLKNYFNDKLLNNLARDTADNVAGSNSNALGILWPPEGFVESRTWMDDFYTWAVGNLVDLGYSEAVSIRDWKAKYPTGRMGGGGAIDTGFCFQFAANYTHNVGNPYFSSFGEMYAANYPAATSMACGSPEIASAYGRVQNEISGTQSSVDSYVANMRPGLAIAVQSGVANTSHWDKLLLSTAQPDFTNAPHWAVVPRTLAAAPSVGPEISFFANPLSVQSGASSTLNWSVTSASAATCTASGGWSSNKGVSGTETVGPLTSTTTFTLSCTNTDGTTSRDVTVSVLVPSAPVVTLSASPNVVANGGTTTLTWSASDATSCAAGGGWSGTKAVSGSQATASLQSDATITFSLTCSGAGGNDTKSITVITVPDPAAVVPDYGTESFTSYAVDADPTDWRDTAAGNSMNIDDTLFKVFDDGGNRVFGTTYTASSNVHAHYTGPASSGWKNYRYSGRMKAMGGGDSLGVTILSDYPNSDSYYRLRRVGGGAFALSTHGSGYECAGDTATGVVPNAGVWYRFIIEAEDNGSATEIRAKVWQDGGGEPANWQVDCADSGVRGTQGTIGVWSVVGGSDSGGKYWDDLMVSPIVQPVVSDSDGDNMLDTWEMLHFGTLARDGLLDFDGDGVSDRDEYLIGINPTLADTDGDGDSDGAEIAHGVDPANGNDKLDDHRPVTPIPNAQSSVPVGEVHRFEASAFSDPDLTAVFSASQWQVARDAGFSNLVLSRELNEVALETSYGMFDAATTYWLRTRHQDDQGLWSGWSSTVVFTTATSDQNDLDGNRTDDRYQTTGVDTDANGTADDAESGICNLTEAEGGSGAVGFRTDQGDIFCFTSLRGANLPVALTSGLSMPYGMFSFRIEGLPVNVASPATVSVEVFFPVALPADSTWYKYDVSSNSLNAYTGAVTFDGRRVVIELTDGGPGDADGVVNGIIVDPSGPVLSAVTTSPDNGESGSVVSVGGGVPAPVDSGKAGGGGFFGLFCLWLLMVRVLRCSYVRTAFQANI